MAITLLLKGIIIGLAATIPLGPIGVICIQRSINKGRLSGFVSGLGAATSDTIFATVAGFSLAFIIDFVDTYRLIIEFVGGIIIILLGVKTFYTNPATQLRRHKKRKNKLFEDYFSTLFLTATNPLIIFYFIALFAAGNIVDSENVAQAFITVAGVFIGGVVWWYVLTTLVSSFRNKFRLKHLWWINKIAGGLIILLGLVAIINVIRRLWF